MKRNPRWMVIAAAVILMAVSGWDAIAGPLPPVHWLPNDPPTIGEPDGSPGGKSYQVPIGGNTIVPIAGGAWTIRLDLGNRLIRLLAFQPHSARVRQSHSHE